jgi:hypothetical protein
MFDLNFSSMEVSLSILYCICAGSGYSGAPAGQAPRVQLPIRITRYPMGVKLLTMPPMFLPPVGFRFLQNYTAAFGENQWSNPAAMGADKYLQ